MLDLLFPPCCMLCDEPGGGLCETCAGRLEPACGSDPPPGIDSLHGICSYEGEGRQLVLALKRGNRRDGLPLLGAALAEAISGDHRGVPPWSPVQGVTWAPTTSRRRRLRGYDQSQLLAASVARALGLRARRCLRRTGDAQMGLDVAHRRANPTFDPVVALEAQALDGLPSAWVLVDDVVTTGATMSAAAEALRAAGATTVIGAAIAITPPPAN